MEIIHHQTARPLRSQIILVQLILFLVGRLVDGVAMSQKATNLGEGEKIEPS